MQIISNEFNKVFIDNIYGYSIPAKKILESKLKEDYLINLDSLGDENINSPLVRNLINNIDEYILEIEVKLKDLLNQKKVQMQNWMLKFLIYIF